MNAIFRYILKQLWFALFDPKVERIHHCTFSNLRCTNWSDSLGRCSERAKNWSTCLFAVFEMPLTVRGLDLAPQKAEELAVSSKEDLRLMLSVLSGELVKVERSWVISKNPFPSLHLPTPRSPHTYMYNCKCYPCLDTRWNLYCPLFNWPPFLALPCCSLSCFISAWNYKTELPLPWYFIF